MGPVGTSLVQLHGPSGHVFGSAAWAQWARLWFSCMGPVGMSLVQLHGPSGRVFGSAAWAQSPRGHVFGSATWVVSMLPDWLAKHLTTVG